MMHIKLRPLCQQITKEEQHMNTFNNIKTTDQVIATLESNGKILARISNRNFANINEVVKLITTTVGHYWGLAKLTIRNRTQGWSMSMALSSRVALPKLNLSVTPQAQLATAQRGVQLSLPW
jgi:hypothetical protein